MTTTRHRRGNKTREEKFSHNDTPLVLAAFCLASLAASRFLR
jgi:hypothetical protein